MASKLQMTGDDIRKMTDEEWMTFRKSSWLKKRAYYEKEMPEYYRPNKESYAKYLDNLQKRLDQRTKKIITE